MIEQEIIEKILGMASIVEVVSQFLSLKRYGQDYIGECPFHPNNGTPTFLVLTSANICKCKVCGKGGNAVFFLMEHEEMSYDEAIEWLAHFYHVEIPSTYTPQEIQQLPRRQGMMLLQAYAGHTFAHQLYNTQEGQSIGLSYFHERGYRDDIIQRFELGYALNNKQALCNSALQAGFKQEYLIQTGFCYGGDNGKPLGDKYQGRVMFPVHNLAGNIIAFGGRILDHVDHAFQKYINSTESEIYHKSDVLYGLYFAKQAIAQANRCYLVEGYFDVLGMHQAGIKNVVASSGTSLTTNQICLIKRFTQNITIIYDGDAAGIRAALRGIDLVLQEGMNVKVLLLPDNDDPDSFARKHTAQEFLDYIAQHETDFIRFKAQVLKQEISQSRFRDPIKEAAMISDIANSISFIKDRNTLSNYIRETSHILDFQEKVLAEAIRQMSDAHELEERKKLAYRNQNNRQNLFDAQTPNPNNDSTSTAGNSDTQTPTGTNAAPSVGGGFGTPRTSSLASNDIIYTCNIDTLVGNTDPVQVTSNPIIKHTSAIQLERKSLPTDRFERNIIRNIVRYGGLNFTLQYVNEEGTAVEEEIRVIDFIGSELYNDDIKFLHPLYAKMYQMALDASEDTTIPFDSIRYFTTQADAAVSLMATDLLADKYSITAIGEEAKELNKLIPRCVLELKDAIIREQIKNLKTQLSTPGADAMSIMQQLSQLNQVRMLFEKELGERIVTNI